MPGTSACCRLGFLLGMAVLLSSCKLARLPIAAVKGMGKKPAPAARPTSQGWGLMSDPALTGGQGAIATASVAPLPGGPDGGTPSPDSGGLFDFSSVTGASTSAQSRVRWIRSAMDATEQSRRTGKPLIILVNNRRSPPGQSIENTLVLQPEFRRLTEETFVPLYLDFSDKATTDSDFYQAFKDRLKVRGYPTILVTLPDGTEVLRLAGYKHEYEVGYMLKIRDSVASCQKMTEARRERLKPAGYRRWTDKKGVVVYARLDKVDANMLNLTTEWGTKFTTFTSRLSEADRKWIEDERAKRQPATTGT